MVDFHTYTQLHSNTYAFKNEYKSIEDAQVTRMDNIAMEADEPPPSPEIYAFPDTIPAYNLRSKKWGMLNYLVSISVIVKDTKKR